jgi:DNA-binding NarL/FixJ family response regulator
MLARVPVNMVAVSLGYRLLGGVLCHLDEVLGQPVGREFPPPEVTSSGVDLYPPLGSRSTVRAPVSGLASHLVGVGSPSTRRSSPSQAITVVTVDGDPLARRALGVRLAGEPDIELLGEASDFFDAVALVSERQPDLVLIAITADDGYASDPISAIVAACPHTRVIVLAIEQDEDAQMQALRAGAVGWLSKSVDLEVLPRILRGVHDGEAAVPRALCRRVVTEAIGFGRTDRNRLRPIRTSLTGREREVVDLLAEGATTAGIASELELRQATVRTHIKHIFGKLGVHSRAEAVRHVDWVRHDGGPPTLGGG